MQQEEDTFSGSHDGNLMSEEIAELAKKMGVRGQIVEREDAAFEVDLDISGYEPEQIRVTVKGNMLTVSGSQEVRAGDGFTYSSRNFSRSYTIPQDILKEHMHSMLLADGHTLKIEAPSRLVPSTPDQTFAKQRS